MRVTIGQKIVFILVLGLLFLLFFNVVSYRNIRGFISAADSRKHSYQILTVLNNIMVPLKEAQSATFEYALTGQQSSITQYDRAEGQVSDGIRVLKELTAGQPGRQQRVLRLESLIADLRKAAAPVMHAHTREDRQTAARLFASGAGLQIMNTLRSLADEIEENERDALRKREELVHADTRSTFSGLLLAGVSAIVIVTFWSFLVLRELKQNYRTKQALGESEERFRLLTDSVNDYAIISVDPDGRIASWNTGAERISGYRADEALGRDIALFYPPEDVQQGKPTRALSIAAEQGRYEEESLHVRKSGSRYWASVIVTALRNEQGELRGFAKVTRDITDRKQSEASMRKLSLSVEQATDLVVMTDREGTIEYINRAAEEIMGYSREELIGKGRDIWRSGEQEEKIPTEKKQALDAGRPFQSIVTYRKKNGDVIYVYEVTTPLKDVNGSITHFVSTGRDITQQKSMEERLNYLAFFDSLTGIPNRTLFMDRLTQGIERARYGRKIIGLLIIDIDRFKLVNDLYGTDAGDRVLKAITARLAAALRSGDTLARLGSDDFGILLFDMAEVDDINLVVKKINDNITLPIKERGEEIVLTSTIGISVYPYDGETARDLFKTANIAHSNAKQQGRNSYQFYTRDMNVKAMEFVSIDKQLFSSFKNREFMLYYQPYWNTATQRLSGMEALIRWNSRNEGVVSPARFIPVLEDTGMIIEVGDWIMKTVCRQIREWQDKGYPAVPVSVNVSSVQFRKQDLADMIIGATEQSSIDPKLLTVEITESTLIRNVEFAGQVLKKLKETGIAISLDDFGTGYSSLSYLQKFPFDNLKIDISFIKELTLDSYSSTIVSAIIAMARSLNLKTIAEGVETEDLWKILRLLQCDMVQGNYFSPPLPSQGVEIYFE